MTWEHAWRRGIVALPTGSGKTRLAIDATRGTRLNALCLVPTRVLLEQWSRQLAAIWRARRSFRISPSCIEPSRLDPFWTPEYVARKVARYRSASLPKLILCIDKERNCASADFPPSARVLRFQRRVDPAAVLRVLST